MIKLKYYTELYNDKCGKEDNLVILIVIRGLFYYFIIYMIITEIYFPKCISNMSCPPIFGDLRVKVLVSCPCRC